MTIVLDIDKCYNIDAKYHMYNLYDTIIEAVPLKLNDFVGYCFSFL